MIKQCAINMVGSLCICGCPSTADRISQMKRWCAPGWASDKDYGDRLYASQMGDAAAFAKSNGVGAYRLCDPGFGPDSGALTPVAPQAHPEPLAVSSEQECESSYPGVCLPPAWVIGDGLPGDLPGWGIYDRNFVVHPPDSHGFDGNQDGAGCEGQR
ncbi:MAG: hypothetical protein R2839_08800 [Thermomicrobiales bacterium]